VANSDARQPCRSVAIGSSRGALRAGTHPASNGRRLSAAAEACPPARPPQRKRHIARAANLALTPGTGATHGRVLRTAMEKALAGFLTKSMSMSLSVKPASRTAGMKAVNTVSNGRNDPPRGSPTWYQPAS
jgi:hypothetical protein